MRIRVAIAVAALTLTGALTAFGQQDPDLGRNLAATCANCHGTNGISKEGAPSLAGETKESIVHKFREFRDGKRLATIMHQLAKGFTDGQVELIADFFSKQKRS